MYVRQRTQKFTMTEVKRLLLEARERQNMPDLWKSFCTHAIHEEEAHIRRDNIPPVVDPISIQLGADSDDDSDGDYDSENEDAYNSPSTSAQVQYCEDVSVQLLWTALGVQLTTLT